MHNKRPVKNRPFAFFSIFEKALQAAICKIVKKHEKSME